MEVIHYEEQAVFELVEEDLTNGLLTLLPNTNKRIYANFLNKTLSKKMRRRIGRMIRKMRRENAYL